MKIKLCALRDASSSHATWQNLSASSLIGQTGLSHDDSHTSILSASLIKDEDANRTVTPNCSLFIPMFFDGKNIL